MIVRYRKKPVVIEAVQYDGNNGEEVEGFLGDAFETHLPSTGQIAIRTLEGEITASVGDYVIRGTEGELYPCKPAAFAATFEPA